MIYFVIYLAGFVVSWLPLAMQLRAHAGMNTTEAATFGGFVSVLWPGALAVLAVSRFIAWREEVARRPPPAEQPPAGGPFR